MKKLLSIALVVLIFISCNRPTCSIVPTQSSSVPVREYYFEGDEPFWRMEIHNDSITLFCANQEIRMSALFAEKSANHNTIGFSNDIIYGIINENWEHNCCYAVSGDDSLQYEIFFVFKGKTYCGGGKKAYSLLEFSDGYSAILTSNHLNYNHIDSISFSPHSFEATYHHCGKGTLNFQENDLKFIKEKTLREELSYYNMRDFEEDTPKEPTAVLLSQGGEEFYLTTFKGVENACGFSENTPVTCKAFLFEVFTKEGKYNEVLICEMEKNLLP